MITEKVPFGIAGQRPRGLHCVIGAHLVGRELKTCSDYDCIFDCSGHRAGAEWAEQHDITDASDCPSGNSASFYEGCVTYTEGSKTEMDDDPPRS